jgi:hypothetical protein
MILDLSAWAGAIVLPGLLLITIVLALLWMTRPWELKGGSWMDRLRVGEAVNTYDFWLALRAVGADGAGTCATSCVPTSGRPAGESAARKRSGPSGPPAGWPGPAPSNDRGRGGDWASSPAFWPSSSSSLPSSWH